jgi:hypothetical protein
VRADQRRQAEAVTVVVARNFGNRAFRVDLKGRHAAPLRDAERLGLAWWPADDRCALTPRGMALAAEYRGEGGGGD